MATLPSEAQRVHRKHINGFIVRFHDMNLANMITAAAASLSNLETIVYYAGSRRTLLSKSSGSALLSATQEVETARASAAMAGNPFNSAEAFEIALWKRRDECFAPMGSRDRFDLTRDIFCRIIDHLLQHSTPGAKPLTVKITCPLKAMFKTLAFDTRIYMFPKEFPKWPAYNRLQRLELRYTSRNMGYPNCFRDDLFVLCGSNGRDQFSNLRSLTLGGVDLTRRGYLNLDLLGKPNFRPDWSNLEMLRLENVQIGSETANFFQEQRSVLEVQNAMWMDHSFEAFEGASQLLGAKLSGTHLLEMIPGSSSVIGTRKNKRFCRFGAWVVAHHEQAAQTSRIQMQSCWAKFEVIQELFVTEAEVEAYMLQGGICPLDDTNIWCFV